jgi:GTPase SAR1 family protein
MDDLIFKLNSDFKKKFLIYGPAGSGKTTYIINIIKNLQDKNIAIIAPTNKALEVLIDKISDVNHFSKISNIEGQLYNNSIKFFTLAKFLNLKKIHNNNFKLNFVIPKNNINIFSNFHIIFIDEVSMIDQNLFDFILHSFMLNKTNIKIIFSGDKYQLPPINKNDSPVFNFFHGIHIEENNFIESIELTTIHRTDKFDIINLCNNIKNWIDQPTIPLKNIIQDNESIKVYNFKNDFIDDYFKSNIFDNDSILLVWRNNTREFYNNFIIEKIRGNNINNFFNINDKIIFLSFYKSNNFKYYSSIKKTIINIDYSDFDCGKKFLSSVYELFDKINFYKFKQNIYNILENIISNNFNMIFKTYILTLCNNDNILTIDNVSKKTLNSIIENIKNIILNEFIDIPDSNHITRTLISFIYFSFFEPFADIDYGYCMTVDKAQGSQFKNVFIDVSDIMDINISSRNYNNILLNAKKRLYTGLSRATNQLFILF